MNDRTIDFYSIQMIGFILFAFGRTVENEVLIGISFVLTFIVFVLSVYWVIKNRKRYRELDKPHRRVFVEACKSMAFSIVMLVLYWIMIVKVKPSWISFI